MRITSSSGSGRMNAAMVIIVIIALSSMVSMVVGQTFRFSTAYGDHMVLQRAPQRATVWGFGQPHSNVVVTVNGHASGTTVDADGKWLATLPAMPTGGPYQISAKANTQIITLNDVLFGDVWVCSGQSNMQMTVSGSNNATQEAADAARYPNIRFNTIKQTDAPTPQDEAIAYWIGWSVAGPATVGGPEWAYLSATCWFWAKSTYDTYGVPLGLLVTNYGGTAVEAWSSPDALAKCSHTTSGQPSLNSTRENPLAVGIGNSDLWNAMIVPVLRTTIYGALWYQGEANAGMTNYWCTFPAMVDDWRIKWNQYTKGQTNLQFPFGFVQLSTWNADNNAVASLRWQQTANFGYVPNSRQVNYFMAEAMDLGSPAPDHDIHPKNKQDVGRRLALGSRAIAYGDSNVYWTGPIVATAGITHIDTNTGDVSVNVQFRNDGARGLELRNFNGTVGFELLDKSSQWIPARIVSLASRNTVSVIANMPSGTATSLRYAWAAVPCEQKQCLIYSAAEAMPALPFVRTI